MKKYFVIFTLFIVLIGIAVRVHKINAPIADWHSWRQVDTAAVARNYVKNGIDLLRPRFDDLSNIPSGIDNPEGWRMVEFPLYQGIAAAIYTILPGFSIEVVLRLMNILSSAFSLVLIIYIVKDTIDEITGLLAGLVFALLPFSIFYSRTVLPEVFMLPWALGSLYLMQKVTKNNSTLEFVVALLASVALLIKPTAAFLLLPLVSLLYKKYGFTRRFFLRGIVIAGIMLFPFWWWRTWIQQFKEGIPAYTWLLNAGNIRFKGAWFYWLFADRISRLILGYWGVVFFVYGALVKRHKTEGLYFLFWLIGALLYLTVFAAGNVQHDYYQILLLPVVSIYTAKGIKGLWTNRELLYGFRHVAVFLIFLFTFAFSWYHIRTYYWINRPDIVTAGKHADELLPADAVVIAPYNGDTTFLYQTNRKGWPIGFDIESKILNGATHYVTVSPTDEDLETRDLARDYTVLVRNDQYAIIDLTKKKTQEAEGGM